MDFGKALEALKEGKIVARDYWNPAGAYIYKVPANHYPAVTEQAKKQFGSLVPYQSYLAMKTPDCNVMPWTPNQNDILSDDWEILD